MILCGALSALNQLFDAVSDLPFGKNGTFTLA
jgi:hypothetical protein